MKKVQAFLIITLLILAACREEYQPQVTQQNLNYLVVEGIINPDSTTVMLSRTRTINDTTTLIPEPNAVLTIQQTTPVITVGNMKKHGRFTVTTTAILGTAMGRYTFSIPRS